MSVTKVEEEDDVDEEIYLFSRWHISNIDYYPKKKGLIFITRLLELSNGLIFITRLLELRWYNIIQIITKSHHSMNFCQTFK